MNQSTSDMDENIRFASQGIAEEQLIEDEQDRPECPPHCGCGERCCFCGARYNDETHRYET